MTTLPTLEPDSIKDRLLQAIFHRDSSATRKILHTDVEGDSAIIEIAINGLIRDQYIFESALGWVTLTAAAWVQYEHLGDETKETATELLPPNSAAASDVVDLNIMPDVVYKTCSGKHGCGASKPIDQFYTGQACCKQCLKMVVKKQTKPSQQAITVALKSPPKKPTTSQVLIIPAVGELTCSVIPTGIKINQGCTDVILTFAQAAALKKWIPNPKKIA